MRTERKIESFWANRWALSCVTLRVSAVCPGYVNMHHLGGVGEGSTPV